MRNEGLGIGGGLVTGDWETLSYRHFERKREIFVIRDQASDVWYSQTENLLSTFIPNSSFEQSFHSQSKDGTLHGRTLNREILIFLHWSCMIKCNCMSGFFHFRLEPAPLRR